jgi:hypothetical protein
MTAVTTAEQFLVPNANPGGRHYSNRPSLAMPSAVLAVPAAGTYYFDCSGILKPGLLNMGIMIQPHGGSVTPAFTLANRDMVLADPSSVPWETQAAVASQSISSSSNHVPSVIRLVASARMLIFVAAC